MGIFATRTRRGPAAVPAMRAELPEAVRSGLPPVFEAVGEALVAGTDPSIPTHLAGRELAREGVSLEEGLALLEMTTRLVRGEEPDYALAHTLSVAWSEATLAFLHQVSCEDPMTGLASAAYLRSRLAELYRGERTEREVAARWALIVADVADPAVTSGPGDVIGRAHRAGRAGDTLRSVFAGEESIARAGQDRLLVLAPREERLGRRVALARRMLDVVVPGARVWIEGLPTTDASAGLLLDELVRR